MHGLRGQFFAEHQIRK